MAMVHASMRWSIGLLDLDPSSDLSPQLFQLQTCMATPSPHHTHRHTQKRDAVPREPCQRRRPTYLDSSTAACENGCNAKGCFDRLDR
ncbi:hypothetical protein BDA96_07G047200 [Sorghum bicolor]|uniref:Uncharacterized protein n=2 Tax=Sorghum bicolor TaxID=4558 RepID=A0A921U8B1_SORBI|nr:hypothetical protein BDA96_07G047200 [Sorghum bicolor]OQU79913.1 hypothetical protein SORBI_3007G044350 [Sorghum bicolor]